MIRYAILAVSALLLAGCQATITMPAYTVSGSQTLTGSVVDVSSSYSPPGNSTASQIRTTTIGRLMVSEPVANYVSNAFRLELRAAGAKLDTGACRVAMKVNDYAIDDLGFNATFISDISYDLTKDKPLYSRDVRIEFTTSKFVAPEVIFASLRSALAQNFDTVLRDPKFREPLTSNCQ